MSIPIPLFVGQGYDGDGMGCILEQIVILWLVTRRDLIDFLADLDHGRTEPELSESSNHGCNRFAYLSSSSSVSDSVGSISIAVEMGHEHVGGWNP